MKPDYSLYRNVRKLVIFLSIFIVIAPLVMLFNANAAKADAIQEAKDREELVLYTGLVVTTLAAAEATGNKDFWDAATDAAAVSDDPLRTLWGLMDATDWAQDAVRIWHLLYGAIGIENAYESTVEFYADQTTL